MANTLKFGNGNWATKDGSTLAYNDESGFNPLPFDFTRASSATVVNKNGLIETVASGIPRIDFKDNTKGALLLEPQRLNKYLYSNSFDVFWSKVNTSTIANSAISPDGVNNAYLLKENTANGSHDLRQGATVTSGLDYTYSIFVKKTEEGEDRNLTFFNAGPNSTISFKLSDGTFFGVTSINSYSAEDYGNGWWRVQFSDTATSSAFNTILILNNGSTSYTGDGVSGVYIYGAQFEEGSYATSLINTSGSAVTREADVCDNGANSEVINSTEGVLYFEGSALADDGTDKRIALSDGTLNNYVSIGYSRFSGNIIAEMFSGGVIQTTDWGATGISQTNNNKFAMSWGSGTMKFYINGVQKQTASVTSPIGMNNLRFSSGNGTLIMFSNTKDVRVFTTALTDAELAALTS